MDSAGSAYSLAAPFHEYKEAESIKLNVKISGPSKRLSVSEKRTCCMKLMNCVFLDWVFSAFQLAFFHSGLCFDRAFVVTFVVTHVKGCFRLLRCDGSLAVTAYGTCDQKPDSVDLHINHSNLFKSCLVETKYCTQSLRCVIKFVSSGSQELDSN
jgi:hypothetical protein